MAKAVLVMDKPDNCCECPFMSWASEDHYCRMGDDGNGGCSVTGGQRPHWCPLIPEPERAEYGIHLDSDDYDPDDVNSWELGQLLEEEYADGWNDCLDELEGKT